MVFRNLHAHNCVGVVLSWARLDQGGNGHINNHSPDYIAQQMRSLGYYKDEGMTKCLHEHNLYGWFNKPDNPDERRLPKGIAPALRQHRFSGNADLPDPETPPFLSRHNLTQCTTGEKKNKRRKRGSPSRLRHHSHAPAESCGDTEAQGQRVLGVAGGLGDLRRGAAAPRRSRPPGSRPPWQSSRPSWRQRGGANPTFTKIHTNKALKNIPNCICVRQ